MTKQKITPSNQMSKLKAILLGVFLVTFGTFIIASFVGMFYRFALFMDGRVRYEPFGFHIDAIIYFALLYGFFLGGFIWLPALGALGGWLAHAVAMRYKKPVMWSVVAASLSISVLAGLFLSYYDKIDNIIHPPEAPEITLQKQILRCGSKFDAIKDAFTRADAAALFGDTDATWSSASYEPYYEKCMHKIQGVFPTAQEAKFPFQVSYGYEEPKDENYVQALYERHGAYSSEYTTLPNLGDDAFYHQDRAIQGLTDMWVSVSTDIFHVRCLYNCTEAQLRSIGQTVLSRVKN